MMGKMNAKENVLNATEPEGRADEVVTKIRARDATAPGGAISDLSGSEGEEDAGKKERPISRDARCPSNQTGLDE